MDSNQLEKICHKIDKAEEVGDKVKEEKAMKICFDKFAEKSDEDDEN